MSIFIYLIGSFLVTSCENVTFQYHPFYTPLEAKNEGFFRFCFFFFFFSRSWGKSWLLVSQSHKGTHMRKWKIYAVYYLTLLIFLIYLIFSRKGFMKAVAAFIYLDKLK